MRILLLESIPLLEEVLVYKLKNSGHSVTTHSALDPFSETISASGVYELLWIDTCILPEGWGKMMKSVRKTNPSSKLLLFGSNETIPEIKNYYMNGGNGYLRKATGF